MANKTQVPGMPVKWTSNSKSGIGKPLMANRNHSGCIAQHQLWVCSLNN